MTSTFGPSRSARDRTFFWPGDSATPSSPGSFQLEGLADRYRLTAFDNRGAGRTPMPGGPVSVEMMADDAAHVLAALDIPSAHVAGFSSGSIISQELALRHPDLVRSLVLQSTWPVVDPYLRSWFLSVRWLAEVTPSERAFLEGFFLWIYTARAHNDGTVDQIIDEVLAFPHKQTTEDMQRFIDAFVDHDTTDRLAQIAVPTLVLAGGRDLISRPELCRAVADRIPGARFEVLEEEAHQPFQEVPGEWNDRVDAFWRQVELRGLNLTRGTRCGAGVRRRVGVLLAWPERKVASGSQV